MTESRFLTASLPSEPGSYLLILRLAQATTLRVGRLGVFDFPAGYYAYCGSARGPGGLAARVGRHLRGEKRRRWHIDYLLDVAEVVDVWGETGVERQECAWARRLLDAGGKVIAPGFGSSDCRCPAHLVYLGEAFSLQRSASDRRFHQWSHDRIIAANYARSTAGRRPADC